MEEGLLTSYEQSILVFLFFFVQLIQLWAAICLLFFYVELLKKSPLSSLITSVNERCNDVVDKFQGYSFSPAGASEKEQIARNVVSDNWDDFRPRIKNIAALTFFYCVIVLFAVGLGRYFGSKEQDAPHIYIFSTSIFVLVYNLCCSLVNRDIFKSNTTPVIYAFVIIPLFYIFCFNWLENQIFKIDILNSNYLILGGSLVAFTCLFGLFSTLFYIIAVWWKFKSKIKKLNSLSENLDHLYDALFSTNPLGVLAQKHQKGLMKKLMTEVNNPEKETINIKETLMEFIIEEAQKEYDEIMNKKSFWQKSKSV